VGIPLPHTVDQCKSLRKVVLSVEKDEVDHLWPWDIQLGEHVQSDESSQPKGSGLEKMRERGDAPSQDIWWL
jgi:hypothetical protein